jgi:hypothetical protein
MSVEKGSGKGRVLAWVCAALVATATVAVGVFAIGTDLIDPPDVVFLTLPVVFAATALLILNSQPAHAVGWVMMFLAVGSTISGIADLVVASMTDPPENITFAQWLALGFNNFGWVLLIYPLFHLLLIFPTGHLLSPRWRFFVVLEVVMVSIMVLGSTFNELIGPLDDDWLVANPVGFIPAEFFGETFFTWWAPGLVIMALGGLASVVVRFVRSHGVERQQMKWLTLSFGMFGLVYALTAINTDWHDGGGVVLDVLFIVSIYLIPVTMGIAILRHRLFDVDLVIRRTVLYGLLTGLLGALYFGSVVLMRSVIGLGNSSLAVAGSTLLVAALFAPLRRRLQELIDRRLFRTRYDMERVIEQFATTAREQSDMGELSSTLLTAVSRTMQPTSTGLWIREPKTP